MDQRYNGNVADDATLQQQWGALDANTKNDWAGGVNDNARTFNLFLTRKYGNNIGALTNDQRQAALNEFKGMNPVQVQQFFDATNPAGSAPIQNPGQISPMPGKDGSYDDETAFQNWMRVMRQSGNNSSEQDFRTYWQGQNFSQAEKQA